MLSTDRHAATTGRPASTRRMTLPVADLLQRVLLHVPAPHTRVVRCSGLSHPTHAAALAGCRAQVGQAPVAAPVRLEWQTVCAQRGDAPPERCPTCGQLLVGLAVIPRGGAPPPALAGERAACARPASPGEVGRGPVRLASVRERPVAICGSRPGLPWRGAHAVHHRRRGLQWGGRAERRRVDRPQSPEPRGEETLDGRRRGVACPTQHCVAASRHTNSYSLGAGCGRDVAQTSPPLCTTASAAVD